MQHPRTAIMRTPNNRVLAITQRNIISPKLNQHWHLVDAHPYLHLLMFPLVHAEIKTGISFCPLFISVRHRGRQTHYQSNTEYFLCVIGADKHTTRVIRSIFYGFCVVGADKHATRVIRSIFLCYGFVLLLVGFGG